MKHLLLPRTAVERLNDRLTVLADKLKIYEMDADGAIRFGDQPVEVSEIDIHLGWLGRDIIPSGPKEAYAHAMLAADNLEWVQTSAAGLDNPFFKMLAEKGIRLSNSDVQAPAIAEFVLASVLNRYQDFKVRQSFQENRQWETNSFREINGSNWLIVGFGNIGKRIGKRAQAFEAKITGVKREAHGSYENADQIITFAQLADELPDQDVVVICCALTDDTRGLVDRSFLQNMKPGAILINVGRGELVKDADLIAALDADQLDYAILDVFATEPLPQDSEYWQHPRVQVTAHSSNQGLGTSKRGDDLFLCNLYAYLHDEPLANEVDIKSLLNAD